MGKRRIIVGMSGGVDSSVVALLLKQQGHDVCGLFMKNWEEWDGQGDCPVSKDFIDMAKSCEQIGIEYHQVNFAPQYWKNVFSRFIDDYKQGWTPNPDVLCNREIKFKVFLEKALELGADEVATGHYCQVERSLSFPRLKKGSDSDKDQSYFLLGIREQALQKTLFPIGHLKKRQVRKIAQDFGLSIYDKKDSTGVCFIGERPFGKFLADYLHSEPGPMETLKGEKVGEHKGLSFYTEGQRKGLFLGGEGRPWFVVGKDLSSNALIVERGTHHPALFTDRLWGDEMSWINSQSRERFRPGQTYFLQGKIRYRQENQDCYFTPLEDRKIEVFFPTPQRAVTLGQYVGLYEGDICLGGGKITRRERSFYHRGL